MAPKQRVPKHLFSSNLHLIVFVIDKSVNWCRSNVEATTLAKEAIGQKPNQGPGCQWSCSFHAQLTKSLSRGLINKWIQEVINDPLQLLVGCGLSKVIKSAFPARTATRYYPEKNYGHRAATESGE